MKASCVIGFFLSFFLSLPTLEAAITTKQSRDTVYYVYTPDNYTPSKKYPLVVGMHWSTGRGTEMIERWKKQADKYGYILACPDSRNPTVWDTEEDADILRVVQEAARDYSIDRKNVLITGFSAGATITYYLGIKHPDVFTAMAPFAGNLHWVLEVAKVTKKMANKPIPTCIVYASGDEIVPVGEANFAKDWLTARGYEVKLCAVGGGHEYREEVSWPIAQWFEKVRK
jgi:phospholipase/carboxylesterase